MMNLDCEEDDANARLDMGLMMTTTGMKKNRMLLENVSSLAQVVALVLLVQAADLQRIVNGELLAVMVLVARLMSQ